MHRLSSHWTLFWKIFFSCLVLTIVYLFALMLIFLDNNSFDIFYTQEAKIAYFVFAIIVFLIIYFTMMDYKRVEFDDEHLFISNYIQTIRIPLDGVRYLKLSKNPFKVSRVHLFQNGRFGKDIKFLKYPIGIEELRKHRPDLVIDK